MTTPTPLPFPGGAQVIRAVYDPQGAEINSPPTSGKLIRCLVNEETKCRTTASEADQGLVKSWRIASVRRKSTARTRPSGNPPIPIMFSLLRAASVSHLAEPISDPKLIRFRFLHPQVRATAAST